MKSIMLWVPKIRCNRHGKHVINKWLDVRKSFCRRWSKKLIRWALPETHSKQMDCLMWSCRHVWRGGRRSEQFDGMSVAILCGSCNGGGTVMLQFLFFILHERRGWNNGRSLWGVLLQHCGRSCIGLSLICLGPRLFFMFVISITCGGTLQHGGL